MGTSRQSQSPPHLNSNLGARRTSAKLGVFGANPTPLDALFILFASVFLLLLLLWITSQIAGGDMFAQLPAWLDSAVKGIWSKVVVGGGSGALLALRRWMYGSTTPSPNYLLWIIGITILLIAALFLMKPLIPATIANHYRLPIRFSAEPVATDIPLKTSDDREISFKPRDANRPIYIPLDKPEELGLYSYDIDVPGTGQFEAEIIHRAIQSRQTGTALHDYEYLLCVKNSPKKSWPSNFLPDPKTPLLKLACKRDSSSGDTKCVSEDRGPGYLLSCDDLIANRASSAVVYAATPVQQREAGWIVPSLDTLDKMKDRERVGYTRFYVSFTPTGKAESSDQYYYAVRVNDKPIYVDGFSPDKFIYPLQKGVTNWISFGLENLNFTGADEGYEKLKLRVVFLKGNSEVYQQDLQRDYIALRPADEVTIESPVGTFLWKGEYVVPKQENKFEVLLASANCGDPVDRACIDRTMKAKTRFDQAGLNFDSRPIVMVVRPPLRKPPSYGLALGVVQPTRQVQFTFSKEDAGQLCHWAMGQIGHSAAGNLIQPNLRIYEVATKGYSPCP